MATRRLALVLCGAVLLGGLAAASGHAASVNVSRLNHLTFSGAVGLPGVTLPRGSYTFEVLRLNPDIVRVLSRDGSDVYFTGFTRLVPRPAGAADGPIVMLSEARPGMTPRITTWYPAGDLLGREFIYPRARR